MSNALRDQLLKAGLITQEQAQQAEQRPAHMPAKRSERKPGKSAGKAGPRAGRGGAPKSAKPRSTPADDLAKAYAARARAEQAERAAREAAEREAQERRRAVKAELQALVSERALNDEAAEVAYRFVVAGKVKQVYVTPEQQSRLAAGELCIVLLDGKRHIVPAEVGERVLALDPERVVVRHDPTAGTEDDVPPDIVW